MRLDPYLGTCVADANRARPCGAATGSPRRDFCAEHVDEADDTFGRCYHCHDGDHELCVGVPCQCECPTPDQRARAALREQALEKLTPEERAALGVSL